MNKTVAKVELVGNKIWLQLPYSKDGADACRSVRGGKWNPTKKVWTYPLSLAVCQEIRRNIADKIGAELKIGPNLWKWADQEKARLAAVPDPESMRTAPIPNVEKANPLLFNAVSSRPFQTVGIAFGAAHRKALIADEPGLGKTIQTIGMAVEAGLTGDILVIAPKVAAEVTWPAELKRWVPEDEVIELGGISKLSAKRKTQGHQEFMSPREEFLEDVFGDEPPSDRRRWFVIGEYWVRAKAQMDEKGNFKPGKPIDYKMAELFDRTWSGVIVDESHNVLICNTANKKKWTQTRLGVSMVPIKEDAIKVAMSGTPGRGKEFNLWGTLNWLDPKLYSAYWKWIDRHFQTFSEPGQQGVEIGAVLDRDAFYAELREVMLRRTKGEVAADLPPKLYGGEPLDPHDESSPVGVWLDMTPAQEKQYKQMVDDGAIMLDGDMVMSNGILSEWTRLKQIAGAPFGKDVSTLDISKSNKFEWIIEFLAERGIVNYKKASDNGKVVIATQFAKFAEALSSALDAEGIRNFLLTGATTGPERRAMQEAWQSEDGPSDRRVFILSTKAGGVSLTLDAADDVIICDETWIPDDQLQVEDRAHRISRPDHQVSIWYLRSRNSIEEAIAAITGGRQEAMLALLDSTRGVDIRKQIINYKKGAAA